MSASGLSAMRLRRLREALTRHIESGDMPGLVALVARRGEVHVAAIGGTLEKAGGSEADAPRHDLPDRVGHQADRGRGGDDPGGGMPAAAGRPGRRACRNWPTAGS